MPGIQIRQVHSAADHDAALAIQDAIFVGEQQIPADLTLDTLNAQAMHVLAVQGDRPVATARMIVENIGGHIVGTIARVAVLAEFRGAGIGRQLVLELETLGRRAKVTQFVLHPHRYLENFYAALGYRRQTDGDHTVAGHELITMSKDVPAASQ